MAGVYDRLSRAAELDTVDLRQYLGELAHELFGTYTVGRSAVRLVPSIDELSLDVKRAVPLGLIVNELLSNALKYAYPEGKKGEVRVFLGRNGDIISLAVSDDGTGCGEDINTGKARGMGLQLVDMLARQVGGSFSMESANGTTARLNFSL
jgi:two-component sensor histidine kinase